MERMSFLHGGGEMGERIRSFDWSASPLGPPEAWPQSLRSAVSIMLPSRAQIALFWGEQLITLYNDAYRPVFGGKHPGALGKPIREAWDELWRAGLKELFDGVICTGEAFWAQARPFFMERHGYLEETYFDLSYDPVRDESGRVGGLFCIVAEVTGRVIGERRLATLRDLGQAGSAASSAAEVYVAAARVLERNALDLPFAVLLGPGSPAAVLGVSGLDAAQGARLAALASSEEKVVDAQGWRLPVAGPWPEAIGQMVVVPLGDAGEGCLVAGVSPRRHLDGDYRDFLRLVASHIGAAAAGVRRAEDARRRAEMLSELDRAKTAFFSNVSHEFRTPLTLMLGPVEDALADEGAPLPPAQRERMALVRRSALRLQKLVNTLLEFSRMEAGRARATFVPTDLATFTAELASSFRSAIERAGLRLHVDCPPLQERIHVDADLWEKIVLNLLSNAFKFTFEGTIGVVLREEGGEAVLEVSDSGTGIPEADLPHVFERFWRAEGARSRTHEGTGIGLALVQDLVKLHGGTVAVRSELDHGSTFTVRIPTGSAHLPAERIGSAPSMASTGLPAEAYFEEALRWVPDAAREEPDPVRRHRPRILLADDNADMRAYLERLLAARYDVEAVPDGQRALEAVARCTPDLVLADVMMPALDGLRLTRALRAAAATSQIPVMLLSARAGEEARTEGLQAGADDYVEKPFSARELLARVGARLEVSRVRREADRRKDEFIATLSHELRNPLAPLRNGLHVLRLSGADGPRAAVAIGMMERQLGQLVRLVDDLLEVSRITRGSVELRRGVVDVARMAAVALEGVEPLMREAGHTVEVRVPASLAVDGDEMRLSQVVGNLLANAARYTPPGGRIAVEAEADGDRATIRIIDNGTGFTPAEAERIFEMFARGERSTGLGIGLALARGLAAMHHGTLEASSPGPGCGATFVLRLPRAASRGEGAGDEVKAQAASLGGRRVLVVDDNADAADTLRQVLELQGADARVAPDGPTAIAMHEAWRPHVVVLDIGMPGMDGHQVARALRQLEHGAATRIVALTGWGQEEDRRRSREAGFDAHLVKPVDPGELVRLLASRDAHAVAD